MWTHPHVPAFPEEIDGCYSLKTLVNPFLFRCWYLTRSECTHSRSYLIQCVRFCGGVVVFLWLCGCNSVVEV